MLLFVDCELIAIVVVVVVFADLLSRQKKNKSKKVNVLHE